MADDQAMQLPRPLIGWPQQAQDASPPVHQSPDTSRRRRKANRASDGLGEPGDIHAHLRPKVVVKQLSLRIDDKTHSKISLAAQKADKSINAWMEEVLSEAAEDVLAYGGDDAISSSAIRKLLEEPQYASRLIESIAPHLQDNSFSTVFQFSPALRKLLVGWDGLKPLLRQGSIGQGAGLPLELVQGLVQGLAEGPQGIANLIAAVLPFLPDGSPDSNSTLALQLSRVLKKLFLGIAAIKPFIKGGNSHILYVVITIEGLLSEIEGGSSTG
jgi:uncharacterized protein (DUF1778 family)